MQFNKFVYIKLVLILYVLEVTSYDIKCPYQGCECVRETLGCAAQNWKTLPPLQTSQFQGVEFLDLEGNPLTVIPAGSLPAGVAGISFEDNPITSIDDTAFDGSSQTLHQLTFTDARFNRIPNALLHLNALTGLVIEDTQIIDWNVDVMKHIGTSLLFLTLHNVGLSSWPTFFQYFTSLQTLELGSSFQSVPSNAFDMQNNTLTSLTLINGALTEVPNVVTKLVALTKLVLDNNMISQVAGLPSFGNLTSLSINNNSVVDAKQLSQTLQSVSDSLLYLYLQGNHLISLPDLSTMNKLLLVVLSNNFIQDTRLGSISASTVTLQIKNNNIRSLSNFLSKAVSLQTLRVGMNWISVISAVDIPSSVVELDLTSNLISELTDTSFPDNSKMESLTLDSNPLVKISNEAFTSLNQLRYLSMKNTKLTRLPISLRYLEGLMVLDLSDNTALICTCLEKPVGVWSSEIELTTFGDCGHSSVDNFLKVLSVGCPD